MDIVKLQADDRLRPSRDGGYIKEGGQDRSQGG
jgi:hypothetical protein